MSIQISWTKLMTPYTRINEDDADSAVWSEGSMSKYIDFSDAQPHSQTCVKGKYTHSFETPDIISICSGRPKEINTDFGEDDDKSIKSHLVHSTQPNSM
ncbi:hypothetical protein AALO_G00298850 [Alosa alosa]|uniref:Uncharacterized protein n=1 Tax=Alosa alosa TaxID=278164 RepID=A0AAV6FE01_9TELE|nr:hypothetical protein AALO_G00298850 [Alosa alosa]